MIIITLNKEQFKGNEFEKIIENLKTQGTIPPFLNVEEIEVQFSKLTKYAGGDD